jgi:hypothetical protein
MSYSISLFFHVIVGLYAMCIKRVVLSATCALLCSAQFVQAQTQHPKAKAKAAPRNAAPRYAAQENPNVVALDLPGPQDNSPWFRYYRGGEAALIKHDPEQAKQYFLASLSELEKSRVAVKDAMFPIKLSALEQYLEGSYPSDWSKDLKSNGKPLSADEKLSLRGEQVQTLYRIAKINRRFVPPNNLLRTVEEKTYVKARASYVKAKEEKKLSSQSDTH